MTGLKVGVFVGTSCKSIVGKQFSLVLFSINCKDRQQQSSVKLVSIRFLLVSKHFDESFNTFVSV